MYVRVMLLAGKRQRGESYRAVQGCNDWLRMGAGRSLPALWGKYTKRHQNTPQATDDRPPTTSLNTLKKWSQRYDWAGRAEAYDARVEEARTARAQEILNSGLAQTHERVLALRRLASFLTEEMFHEEADGSKPKLWLPDVKQIGSGESAERVDLVRFNEGLVRELRGALDDLAKETGGRTAKVDVTSKGQAIKGYFLVSPDDWPGPDPDDASSPAGAETESDDAGDAEDGEADS